MDDFISLKNIKNQTPEMCLRSVIQNWQELKYVENQTREICITAIKINPRAIVFIKTHDIEFYKIINKSFFKLQYDEFYIAPCEKYADQENNLTMWYLSNYADFLFNLVFYAHNCQCFSKIVEKYYNVLPEIHEMFKYGRYEMYFVFIKKYIDIINYMCIEFKLGNILNYIQF